jgi:hypothetical protein
MMERLEYGVKSFSFRTVALQRIFGVGGVRGVKLLQALHGTPAPIGAVSY